MNKPTGDEPALELDDFVLPFETARKESPADLAEFLPPAGHPLRAEVLCELVRVDLEYGWRQGRPTPLADYVERFPTLQNDRGFAEIAFEEFRLRRQAGEEVGGEEYRQRWGVDISGWPADAATGVVPLVNRGADFSCDLELSLQEMSRIEPRRASRLDHALASFPAEGEEICGFRLVAELGRGSFGRVYLAQQRELADRPVVLKLTPAALCDEARTLARLQHTHIVPIYSVHRPGPFVVVCMPYLGRVTLADVLRHLRAHDSLPATGKGLVDTLLARAGSTWASSLATPASDDGQAPAASAGPSPLTRLQELSYVEAVLWIASRLADGLAHAHERGILHRDLKPANVLLSDEGLPMLLDFNLAEDLTASSAAAARLGGTLPYLAPEYMEALAAQRTLLDPRCDVYALGLILFELLAGRPAFPTPSLPLPELLTSMITDRRQAPSARAANPAVSPATDAIVRRCLAPEPSLRYQSAAELREDLERQLAHQPLRHAPDRSPRERFRKWTRRHPRLASSTTVALLALTLLLLAGAAWFWQMRQTQQLDARDALEQVRRAAATVPFLLSSPDIESEQRAEGLRTCSDAASRFDIVASPRWLQDGPARRLASEEQQELRRTIGELCWFWARAVLWEADTTIPAARRGEALDRAWLLHERGFACFDEPPAALLRQRAKLLRERGCPDEARTVEESIPGKGPSLQARFLDLADAMDLGHCSEALPYLHALAQRDSRNPVAWLVMGNAYQRQGQFDAALDHYRVGLALDPDFVWGLFNCGLLEFETNRLDAARQDFTRVLELRPGFVEARINRAMIALREGNASAACADLDVAAAEAPHYTRILAVRLRARLLRGDQQGARADREELFRRDPEDEVSWIARGVVRLPADPTGALHDFEQAIALNPRSRLGLQNKVHVLSEYLKRTEDAVAVLDHALEVRPEDGPARAARGVLLARVGRREAAHTDAQRVLAQPKPLPALVFQTAGIYALTSRTERADAATALRLLRQALRDNPALLPLAERDPDLAPLRERADFQELLRSLRALP
jgi:serine/threonine protein kinase/Tfp pilus assembly protein PilF